MSEVVLDRLPTMTGFAEPGFAEPVDPLAKITARLQSAKKEQEELMNNSNEDVQEEQLVLSIKPQPVNTQLKEEIPSTYENIMKEIQQHEEGMENAIREADELSKEVKDSIMYYLGIRKPNRNGILMNGVPDVLQASARLLDLSINGRYKLASMKKLRASILKDMSVKGDSNEISLADLLK